MDELMRMLGRSQREALEEEALVPAQGSLDDETRESMVDAVFEQLGSGSSAEALAVEPAGADEGALDEGTRQTATVVPLHQSEGRSGAEPSSGAAPERSRSWRVVLGPLVAVAAALVLWWTLTPSDVGPDDRGLPGYAISRLEGGAAEVRGDSSSESLVVRPDSVIDWVFTPERPVSGPLVVVLRATSRERSAVVDARVDARISAQGGIRLQGSLADHIALTPGEWTMKVLVGRSGAPPDELSPAAPSTWQLVEFALIIAPSG